MPTTVVVLSDLHLGAPDSLLRPNKIDPITRLPDPKEYAQQLEPLLFGPLRQQLGGRVKYLVVAGDFLDFALQSYGEACATGAAFFKALAKSGLFEEIVCIPGNHDHDIWNLLEQEINVINPLTKGKLPGDYPHVQAGILDASTGNLALPGVNKPYGDFFLKGLFQVGSPGASAPSLPINVVYPNLFITGGPDPLRPIVVTHGHFLFLPWIVLTEIFPKSLELQDGYSLMDLEVINNPLTALAWTALGQAGKLAVAASKIYDGVESGNTKPLKVALDELATYLGKKIFPSAGGWVVEIFKGVLEGIVAAGVASTGTHRSGKSCLDDPDTQTRITNYLALTRSQFSDLEQGKAWLPSNVIFGHTHQPIRPEHNASLDISWRGTKYNVKFTNPGGWQTKNKKPPAVAITVDNQGGIGCIRFDT